MGLDAGGCAAVQRARVPMLTSLRFSSVRYVGIASGLARVAIVNNSGLYHLFG
jgi:hypothetical protein